MFISFPPNTPQLTRMMIRIAWTSRKLWQWIWRQKMRLMITNQNENWKSFDNTVDGRGDGDVRGKRGMTSSHRRNQGERAIHLTGRKINRNYQLCLCISPPYDISILSYATLQLCCKCNLLQSSRRKSYQGPCPFNVIQNTYVVLLHFS